MQQEILSSLRSAISFKSTVENPQQKQECLDWMLSGFFTDDLALAKRGEVEGSPYVYFGHPDAKLLWFGHFDVVPGREDQFILETDDDTAYGRGVKDMKGGIVPFLHAWRDVRSTGSRPPVSILLTSDEETAGKTIPTLFEENILEAPCAFTPDTGESTWIVTEHKGAVWAELNVEGKRAHSAYPWNGESAILRLGEILKTIETAFPTPSSEKWTMTVTPTKIHAGTARNQLPDNAVCTLDIRYIDKIAKSPEEALKLIEDILPPYASLTPLNSSYPLFTPSNHPLVLQYQKIASEVEDRGVATGKQHGTSDTRFFHQRNIPSFLYGPHGGGHHSDNEWVSISSLVHQYEISKRWLEELCD